MIIRHTKEEYEACVRAISDTPKFVSGRNKSGNGNLSKVLDTLGHPERRIRCIHVAGTNGKGSTVQLIKRLLVAGGFRVGTFISPHLTKINERIIVSYERNAICVDEIISDDDFCEAAKRVDAAVSEAEKNGGVPLSYFEYLFAMAAVYFCEIAEETPDYVVWETGLGGRLDATNLVTPLVSVITSIGIDHTKYLGSTLTEIAGEKAGIIKPGVPVVSFTKSPEADAVVFKRAGELGCAVINGEQALREEGLSEKGIDFSLVTRYYSYDHLCLNGQRALYQADNAACALLAGNEALKDRGPLPRETVDRAFFNFTFAGRMERVGPRLVLDGAHNEAAVRRFIEAVKEDYPDCGIRLLFAVAGDKDYEPMIRLLATELRPKCCYVTALASERALAPEFVAAYFSAQGIKTYQSDSIRDCLEQGMADAALDDDILFCVGSLYLIGSIKELI